MTTAVTLSLPADLAPDLRQAVHTLLEQVGSAPTRPDPSTAGGRLGHRCSVCHRGGKLSGHHENGQVVWIHRRCHHQLHRRRDATGRNVR